jgi:hypothetical protein
MTQKKNKPSKKVLEEPKMFSGRKMHLLAVIAICIVVLLAYHDTFLNGKVYDGGDNIETIIKANKIQEFYESTGEVPRWNPYPDAGIPNVFWLPPSIFSLTFFLDTAGRVVGISVLYLVLGAIGFYFLLHRFSIDPLVSLVASLGFVLNPYFKSLVITGIFLPSKLQAIMLIPWLIWMLVCYFEKGKILHLLLFSLLLNIQFLSLHFQVIFYSLLLLMVVSMVFLYQEFRQKVGFKILKKPLLLLLAAGFALLLSSYPLLLSKKYNEFSIRANAGIDLSKAGEVNPEEQGIDLALINEWSLHPREFLDFILPRASGGTSSEKYTGTDFPEISGQLVPAYWGNMNFSGSYLYLGLPIILAFLGLFHPNRRMVLGIVSFGILLLLWSLGTFFQSFYLFFYHYLPFFKNFRTPPTSLTVFYFIIAFLSAFGISVILDAEGKRDKRVFLFLFIGLAFAAIVLFFFGRYASFIKPDENYSAAIQEKLIAIRRGFYFQDFVRFLVIISLFAGIILLHLAEKVRKITIIGLIGLLIVTDLISIQYRYPDKPMTILEIKEKYFPDREMTGFFEADKDPYRVYSPSEEQKYLTSIVPTLDQSDLQILIPVNELFTNNLHAGLKAGEKVNANMLKLLAVKYVVSNEEITDSLFQVKFTHPAGNRFVYQYKEYLQMGHFVENFAVEKNPVKRLEKINDTLFNPAVTAILENPPTVPVFAPDSSSCRVVRHTPNEMEFELFTDTAALFVVSVPFLPGGWILTLDNERINEIYPTNHAFQSIVVERGNHTLRLEFNKDLHTSTYIVSALFSGLLYILLLVLWLLPKWKQRKKPFPISSGK